MQRKTVGVSNGTAADPTCIGSKACAWRGRKRFRACWAGLSSAFNVASFRFVIFKND
jgi:hypothetical protein